MIQETMLRSFNVNKLTKHFKGFKWFIKTRDGTLHPEDIIVKKGLSYHGTALAVRLDIAEAATEIKNDDKNIITVSLALEGEDVLLANLYLPTRGQDDEFAESVSVLEGVIENSGKDLVIAMGDVNNSDSSTVRRKSCWAAFLKNTELTDNRTGEVTHVHKVTGKSDELDRLLYRKVKVLKTRVLKDGTNASDHRPVLAELSIEV